MPLVHEFGIIDDINDKRLYTGYVPELNDCIVIDDDIILELVKDLEIMKTYFHDLTRPNFGLAYHGITLIPPQSLALFLEIVLSNKKIKHFEDTAILCTKIQQAIKSNKFIVHFGI
jgi:hypothetical protein